MAITNHERVGKMLELLCAGLQPFVERELKNSFQDAWIKEVGRVIREPQLQMDATGKPQWDVAAILIVMWKFWNDVFRLPLGHAERSMVSELREARNRWAHQRPFSTDDAYRALDSASRLLTSVSAAKEADAVEKMKMELLRVRFDEQVRTERRRVSTTVKSDAAAGQGIKPWREVVSPHQDVASGRYQQAEFAADLWQVHIGEGSTEYRDPAEFFRRTFLTESLSYLLSGAVQRLSGKGGDPVVQLQTNFGGGKTHSMLALYHLFSGTPVSDLSGVESIVQGTDITKVPTARRVVLVGNKISPGNPVTKPDGTVINTLWGELAWQLGGKAAYERLRADDEQATNPGDRLRELFNEYGPCLILIDEWVAYARQLHDQGDLPGGNFETHFTFAQALTETAKTAQNTLLVISLPASDTGGSPHAQADDIEVGGERGRAALDRLRNAVGRVESSWRPASAEEGFEIVRRRLFEPLIEQPQFVARDNTAKSFYNLYRTQHQEFPPECRDADYEKRLKAAYPIHPEVFDRLYSDWSTLIKFQRTRGVLRLMAAVIHSLWEKGDRSPMILPSNVPIDDPRVQFELTRYLSDNWVPVIEKDVDGPNALPLRIDGEVPNLGKFSACRRVARTIYMGSAPTSKAANKGVEDRMIKLGCVMPGESPAVFGDALRRLSSTATYLYQDGARYWYSTQPTVTKLAEDRAEQLKGDPDSVVAEIRNRLDAAKRNRGDFCGVHPMPSTSADVEDSPETRLVILGIEYSHTRETTSPALKAAKSILENRGNTPRLYRNTLVFLAPDKNRLQDLEEAVRRYLAWESIISEVNELNLDPHQERQAKAQRDTSERTAVVRIPEVFQWLIVPVQATPQGEIDWQTFRLTGSKPLAVRASNKLINDALLQVQFPPTLLRLELDRIPLWRTTETAQADHVEIRQLAEDFARYIYLPRLKNTSVLVEAIHNGVGLFTWSQDSFAYAESFDEDAGRYRGLRVAQHVNISPDSLPGLLVRPEPALKQYDAERAAAESTSERGRNGAPATTEETRVAGIDDKSQTKSGESAQPKRFHGTVKLDATRVGRDAGRVADEVISHLAGLVGSNVTVTLEIAADISSGTPENVVRTVTENCQTLKFSNHGFEKE
ncbi:MAG: ATP-binding protein [Desulfosarcina sp.]|nr:ATP-binding protein [Desulfosarcina sp.]MBC2742859.1 ATP-binding protein [Desulfosarcina sp.]MBC2765769.1 ATP-binding protein [Desulfosarcina sp.]